MAAIDQGIAMHRVFTRWPTVNSAGMSDGRSGTATCQYLGDIFGQHFPLLQGAVWSGGKCAEFLLCHNTIVDQQIGQTRNPFFVIAKADVVRR